MNAFRRGLPRLKAPAAALRPLAPRVFRTPSTLAARPLSTTPAYHKKNKSAKAAPPPPPSAADSEEGPTADPEDPHNFGDVKARFAHLSTRFTAELKQARQGTATNPSSLASLSVSTKDGPFPLRELAQVVPRNRTISLLVNDASHVKPIMSAVQASGTFNQQPQRDPENELELVMRVDVVRPEEVKKGLKEVCHVWRERLRGVRQKRDKVLAGWKKDGTVTADVARKLGTELTNIMKKELGEVDKAEAQAIAQVDKSRG